MRGPPDLVALPYVRLAGALLSGPVGMELFDLLCAEFPAISRGDAFLGVATALALMKADALAAEMEARRLRLQLEQREAS